MGYYASKGDFARAPVGHPFMEGCGVCGQETGSLLVKSRGPGHGRPARAGDVGRILVHPDSRCEFCAVLGVWLAGENIDPSETGLTYGVSKLVTVGEDGGQALLAYIPFSSDDDLDKYLVDGTPVSLRHGTVIRCELGAGLLAEGDTEAGHASLVEVLEVGV